MKLKFLNYLRRVNPLFAGTVIVPTLCSILYFGLWASDVYVSESSFVVRAPERQSSSPFGALLRSASFNKAADEAYTVRDYILSRDALQVLNEKVSLGKAYFSSDVDVFSRFAGLDYDDSFEALHRYYVKKITVQADSASSIVTLAVRAFSPQDAYNANRVLLEQSEALINRLSERGRQDLINFAAREVKEAEHKAKLAALSLSSYRDSQGVVDPERQASVQLQQVAKLQDELIATTTQISQLQTFAPANPQIASLRVRAETLRRAMAQESERVAGGSTSLANKAAVFQRFALERDFADKQLASALSSLENARNEAQRKQVYIERIAQPSLPDVAQEPRRIRGVVATFLIGLAVWGILSILTAAVRDHKD